MIGSCIALAIWASGLLYFTTREEKRKGLEMRSEEVHADDKGIEDGVAKQSSA